MSLSWPRTLVNWWWMKLWLCFHCSAGCAVSHSQVEEWISGSFIQSHWPCMTLCPISMFSKILATPSIAVPASQAGFHRLASRVTRAVAASPRWTLIIRLMYAASASPRDSSISVRIASSSRPSSSTSSGVRWAYWVTSLIAMALLDVERAGPDRDADAGLDTVVLLVVLVAVAQVAHGALDEGERARVADAHPAAEGHADADRLARLEAGGGAVDLDGPLRVLERDRPALAAVAGDLQGEALEVQGVPEVGPLPVLLDRVEHRRGAAGPRVALAPVGDDGVEVGEVEQALGVGVPLVQGDRGVALGQGKDLVAEDRPLGAG